MEFNRNMKLEYNDYLRYNLTHSGTGIKRCLYWIIPAVATLLFTIPLTMSVDVQYKAAFAIFFTLIIFGILALVFWLMAFLIKKLRTSIIHKAAEQMYYIKNRQLQDEYDLIINNNGITHIRGEETTYAGWNQIVKVLEDENAIYIYFSKIRAFIVLKRNLQSADELNALKQLCLQHVPRITYKPLNR